MFKEIHKTQYIIKTWLTWKKSTKYFLKIVSKPSTKPISDLISIQCCKHQWARKQVWIKRRCKVNRNSNISPKKSLCQKKRKIKSLLLTKFIIRSSYKKANNAEKKRDKMNTSKRLHKNPSIGFRQNIPKTILNWVKAETTLVTQAPSKPTWFIQWAWPRSRNQILVW